MSNGGPAFPTENERQTGANSYHYEGMSLRDYLAAHCPDSYCDMEGWTVGECAAFICLPEGTKYNRREHYRFVIAKLRYEYADAMLKERSSTAASPDAYHTNARAA